MHRLKAVIEMCNQLLVCVQPREQSQVSVEMSSRKASLNMPYRSVIKENTSKGRTYVQGRMPLAHSQIPRLCNLYKTQRWPHTAKQSEFCQRHSKYTCERMMAPVTNAVGKNEYTENQKWIPSPSLCFLIQLQMDERCKD